MANKQIIVFPSNKQNDIHTYQSLVTSRNAGGMEKIWLNFEENIRRVLNGKKTHFHILTVLIPKLTGIHLLKKKIFM